MPECTVVYASVAIRSVCRPVACLRHAPNFAAILAIRKIVVVFPKNHGDCARLVVQDADLPPVTAFPPVFLRSPPPPYQSIQTMQTHSHDMISNATCNRIDEKQHGRRIGLDVSERK